MAPEQSRRDLLKTLGLAGIGLSVAATLPEFVLPALAQGETVVPFSDFPANFNPNPNAATRTFDIRKIEGPFTPADQFFTTQHYGHPTVDLAAFRLKMTGMVASPQELSLDDLKKLGSRDLVAGFECSGNSPRLVQGFAGNGKWTGIPLRLVLDRAGVHRDAREFVFFGADKGQEEVEWRNQKFTVEQQFGRSLTREQALSGEPFLAWALNGQPLTVHQGSPLRLLVPGWYGVANVKWLSNLHVQAEPVHGQVPDALVSHTSRGEHWRRHDAERNGHLEDAPEVGHRPGDDDGQGSQGDRLHPERRHADPVGGGAG